MKRAYDAFLLGKYALKNIWRNRKRAVLTMASVCIGTVALILIGGYIKIMEVGLKSEAINRDYGHIQIARTGYFEADDTSYDFLIPREEFLSIEDMLYGLPETDMVNKRLHIAGIIGNMERSSPFLAICGDPDAEIFMLPNIIEGEPISGLDPAGVVIGRGMAAKLDIDSGGSLLLFFSSESGAQEAILVSVKGIYKGLMKEQENMVIYVPLPAAWDLMLEEKIHRIIVFLRSEEDIEEVLSKINVFIEENELELEARTWEELAVYYRQIINLFRGITLVAGAIIFIVIIFGISNTMYMVITERTREIGTLRAIGKKKSEIMGNFVTEGILIGLIGAGIGVALSSVIIPLINSLSLTLPPGPGQDERIPIHILFDGMMVLRVFLISTLTASAASIFPALRATQRKIVDALRQF